MLVSCLTPQGPYKRPAKGEAAERQDCLKSNLSRRRFIAASTSSIAVGAMTLGASSATAKDSSRQTRDTTFIRPGDVVVFQGDSITSSGRQKHQQRQANSLSALGNGYAWLAASQFLVDHPHDPPQFFNRAVGGAFLAEMAERWQRDCLDLMPNVISILIGVNDYWHRYLGEYGGTHEQYVRDYRNLLARTREALPDCRIVIGEPFMYPSGPVTEEWFSGFVPHREATRRIAEEAGAIFIPNQTLIDAECKLARPEHWSADGCHPTAAGAAHLAYWWLKAILA